MTAVHPWLVGAAWTLAAVTLVIAVWGLISDEVDALLRSMFVTAVGSAVIGAIARVANPFIDADDRFHAWLALSMLVLGLCMLWEYLADWDFKPFRFVVWVPPAIALIRAAMTIPNLGQILSSMIFIICVAALVSLFCYFSYVQDKEREQLRATAYHKGVGDEYDLELKQLLQQQSIRPKDAPLGPDPYSEALQIALLRKRIMAKNPPPPHNDFSNSIIGNLNLGTVQGDLHASVKILRTQGDQQIADVIEKLTDAISKWARIDDAHRKDLLENVAQVSKEASTPPDQRKSGMLKASLAFLTTSLSTAKELAPLVHDLYEKLRAAGIINW